MKIGVGDLDYLEVEKARAMSQEEHEALRTENHKKIWVVAKKKVGNCVGILCTAYMKDPDLFSTAMCKSVAQEIQSHTGEEPYILEFYKASKNLNPYGEEPSEYNWNTKAEYNTELNRLIIYEIRYGHSTPIYMNDNGVICNDRYGLEDCGCSIY